MNISVNGPEVHAQNSHHSLRIIKILKTFLQGSCQVNMLQVRNRNLHRPTQQKWKFMVRMQKYNGNKAQPGLTGLESHQESECPMLSSLYLGLIFQQMTCFV